MTKRASTTVRYEARTTIDRPIDEVFGRLADLDGYTTWMRRTGLFRRSRQTSDGPVGRGTAYSDATRMGTFRGEVVDYEAPGRIGFSETLRWFGSDLMEARPGVHPRSGPGQDGRSSPSGGGALRNHAVDETGRGAIGEERARPNSRVAEAFAGVGIGLGLTGPSTVPRISRKPC
jgi:hypothetical protein